MRTRTNPISTRPTITARDDILLDELISVDSSGWTRTSLNTPISDTDSVLMPEILQEEAEGFTDEQQISEENREGVEAGTATEEITVQTAPANRRRATRTPRVKPDKWINSFINRASKWDLSEPIEDISKYNNTGLWIYKNRMRPKKIIGMEVSWGTDPNQRGKIISIETMANDLTTSKIDDVYVSIAIDEFDHRQRRLWQIEALQELPIIRQPKDHIAKMLVQKIVNRGIINRKEAVLKIEREIIEVKRYIEDYERSTDQYRDQYRQALDKQKNAPDKEFSVQKLLQEIESLKKHQQIETAYITDKGNLIVITKELHPIDNETGKPLENNFACGDTQCEDGCFTDRDGADENDDENDDDYREATGATPHRVTPIGRMIFSLNYGTFPSTSYRINADNLDYIYHGSYPHPNISGSKICQGDNEREISRMFDYFQIFLLVDFLITFMTLWPHDYANPYVNENTWLAHKRERDNGERKTIITNWGEVKI